MRCDVLMGIKQWMGRSSGMDAPFNRQGLNQPLTYRALRKLALAIGWQEDKTQGKGSHRKFVRKGYGFVTLPCHGEDTEYSRGWTRKFLKQILEPLDDVCVAPTDGLHQVEQVTQVIGEMLEYLPAQLRGEYDRAIAEMKANLQDYRQAQQLQVDNELAQYEERRLAECEKTIAALNQEKTESPKELELMLAAGLIQQRRKYQSIQERQTALLEDFDRKRRQLREEKTQTQSLQTQLEALQQKEATLVEQNRQAETVAQQQIHVLIQSRKRDRWIIFGLLALSVGLGVVLVHEIRREPRSPQISTEIRNVHGQSLGLI